MTQIAPPEATQTEIPRRGLTPLQLAAGAAHEKGLHSAMPDVHCPRCEELGYVGASYDRERQNAGGQP